MFEWELLGKMAIFSNRIRIGDLLVHKGYITEDQLSQALEEQQKRTVTTLKTDNSQYSKKLDEIFEILKKEENR